MPETRPKVSVILPVNRDDGFLSEAIESVLNQTLVELELIIIANRCSDELWEKISSYADKRVRPYRTSIGQLPFNLNIGIEHARSDYVARMDADDICEPDRLKKQCEFLDNNLSVDVVGTSYCHIDATGQIIGYPRKLRLKHEEIVRRLPFESCMPHPTVVFRRNAVLEVGGYAYGLYAEDWDLWIRLARAGKRLANIDEPLLRYRIHSQQSTSFAAARRNIANVIALQIREFVLTSRPVFILGAVNFLMGTLVRAVVFRLRKFLARSWSAN